MKKFLLLILCCTLGTLLYAQTGVNDTIKVSAELYKDEYISSAVLEQLVLYSRITRAQQERFTAYNRLRNAVYVTYPYARRAGLVMNEINVKMAVIASKEGKKKIIRDREKDLKKEFSDPLQNLSVYQGKVLMKLINRETGNNCYDIIKEYKGGVTARFYQTVAFFFNSNLKQPYDPKNEDRVIEEFVVEVQRMYGFAEIRPIASL